MNKHHTIPYHSPVAVYLRYLDVFKRLDRVGGSDGVLKGGWERGRIMGMLVYLLVCLQISKLCVKLLIC